MIKSDWGDCCMGGWRIGTENGRSIRDVVIAMGDFLTPFHERRDFERMEIHSFKDLSCEKCPVTSKRYSSGLTFLDSFSFLA